MIQNYLINYVMEMVRVIGLWNQYRDPSPDEGPRGTPQSYVFSLLTLKEFTITMDVHQVIATLVSDLTQATAPVITTVAKAHLDLRIFSGTTDLALRLSDWEFNRTRPGISQTEDVCIIEPCQFLFTLQGVSGKESNMGVVINALELAMTYPVPSSCHAR